MRDLTFYLANTPPLLVPRLDVNIIRITGCRSAFGTNSVVRAPETRWSRSTDRGWLQRRERGFVLSHDVLLLTDTTRKYACSANFLAVLWRYWLFLNFFLLLLFFYNEFMPGLAMGTKSSQ